jgi:hypothetical protein
MKTTMKAALVGLTCLAVTAVIAPAYAVMIAPQPIPLRVAHADVVVVGKVTKIEDKLVSAPAFPGAKDTVGYQIAVVKVDDPVLNAKGLKEVRVGFVPPPAPGGGPGPRLIGPRFRGITLVEDEEACLLLTKHFDGDFYIMSGPYDAIKKANNANYEKDLEEAKKAAKLLADPLANLKGKEADDRFQVAAMLIERYRTTKLPAGNPPKQEAIDAAESKLILEALRDADWAPPKPTPGRFFVLTPVNTFFRLNLTKDDNWSPPKDGTRIGEAAQAWLKENADTYRIKKFVAEKSDDKKGK